VANTTYSYTVEAYDTSATPNVSLPSNAVSVTTQNLNTSTPPSAPTDVTAAAKSPTTVFVSWNASTDTGGPGIGGYYVLRNGVNLTPSGVVKTNYYTDNSAVANTTYSYTVEAYDTSATPNVSLPSNIVTINTPSPIKPVPPSQPTQLSATAVTSSQINLSWLASTDASGVAGYNIYRNNIQIAKVTTTSYGDTGLNPSNSYSYYVVAFDSLGNSSAASATVKATTLAAITTTTLEGVITSTLNKQPIANAIIDINRNGNMSYCITNAQGQYVLSGIVANQKVYFTVMAKGYQSQSDSLALPAGVSIHNFSLRPLK
jgi:chitodextrinase